MQGKATRNTIRTLAAGSVLGTALLFAGAASAHGGHRHGPDPDDHAQRAGAELILRALVGNAQPAHYRGHAHRFQRPGYYRHGRFYAYPRYGARPLYRHHKLHKRWHRRHDRKHHRAYRWHDRKHHRADRWHDRKHHRADRWDDRWDDRKHRRDGRRDDARDRARDRARDGRRHAH